MAHTSRNRQTDADFESSRGRLQCTRVSMALALLIFLATLPAGAATLWVGLPGGACVGSNVFPTVNAAILSAALSSADDTIRLANSLTYDANDIPDLVDWNPATTGTLRIEGGWSDCFGTQSGRTEIAGTTGNLITVRTSSQPESDVTLASLFLNGSDAVGVLAQGGAEVSLVDTLVEGHPEGGVRAEMGADVILDSSSIVRLNGVDNSAPNNGGGLWCGAGSSITSGAWFDRNAAAQGGGFYIDDGCVVELLQGSKIDGFGSFPAAETAFVGGGAYVADGGVLISSGGNLRVEFRWHDADTAAGIYVEGSGVAALTNTLIFQSSARLGGAAITVEGNGTSAPQLTMDRASGCQFPPFSCSEFEGITHAGSGRGTVINLNNARAVLRRTVFDLNDSSDSPSFTDSLIELNDGSVLEAEALAFQRNTGDTIFKLNEGSTLRAAHLTITGNSTPTEGSSVDSWAVIQEAGSSTDLRNSLFTDTKGVNSTGGSTILGSCNLSETANGFAPGSVFIGLPVINSATDFRQAPESVGVDMCGPANFDFSSTRDIEWQDRPFDVPSNNNGFPGQLGQIWDAGADEVTVTIPDLLFRDGFESGNTSAWSSTVP